MKLNQATDYAFRMVLYMSLQPYGTKITGGALAKAQNIPERFLLKIMRSLTAAKIMHSFRGVDGGFTLLKRPHEITLFTVIEAVEGETYLQKCLYSADSCTNGCQGFCAVRQSFAKIQERLINDLKSVTFAELAEQEREIRKKHEKVRQ